MRAVPVVVQLDAREPDRLDERDGWRISAFRTCFGDENASSSLLFRASFRPGAQHQRHRHDRAPEISICLRGAPIAGTGDDVRRIGPDTWRWISPGVEHFLATAADDREPTEIVGIYIGAGSMRATGYVHTGPVSGVDLLERPGDPPYPCVTPGAGTYFEPSRRHGWSGARVVAPLSARNGCGAIAMLVDAGPGARRPRLVYGGTDSVVYVSSGRTQVELGSHERLEAKAGDAIFIPSGVEHAFAVPAGGSARLITFLTGVSDLSALRPSS